MIGFIILNALFFVFVPLSLGGSAFVGKYDIGGYGGRDVIIEGNYAYIAATLHGLKILDISNPAKPILKGSLDIAPDGMTCNAIAKQGDYVYCAVRKGAGKYTSGEFFASFEEGDNDLSDGSDTEWDGGTKIGTSIEIVGNESESFWGDYCARVSWTSSGTKARTYKMINGGEDNYAIFWMKISKGELIAYSATAKVRIFEQNDQMIANLNIIAHSNHYTTSVSFNDESEIITTASDNPTAFYYDKWYQFKICFKVHASLGGCQYWYRSNLGDSFFKEADNLMRNTNSQTPNKLSIGLDCLDEDWPTGTIYFDEIIYDKDLAEVDDDGVVVSVNVINPETPIKIDEIWSETKPSGVYAEGDYLYVGSQSKGLVVYDISDPANLQYVSAYHRNEGENPKKYDTHGLVKQNHYIYCANTQFGFFIVDVSDVENPVLASHKDFEYDKRFGSSWDCEVDGSYLYISARVAPTRKTDPVHEYDKSGLWIVDISYPMNPETVGYAELPYSEKLNYVGVGDPTPQMISKEGKYIYMANGKRGCAVIDINDPTYPFYAFSLKPVNHNYKTNCTGVDCKNGICIATSHALGGANNAGYIFAIFPSDIGTCYEDAEDNAISRWNIYDNTPEGAFSDNVFDIDRQSRVIGLNGARHQNGYKLKKEDGNNWQNFDHFVIEWNLKYSEFFTVYINTETTAGCRLLTYKPVDYDKLGGGKYVHYGLGSNAIDGQWHTFFRDLQVDLSEAQPGIDILQVNGFSIRGSGRVDDVKLHFTLPDSYDFDLDGIPDENEVTFYDTDPNKADTDEDGINDGNELSLWEGDWNSDNDNDSIINLLDNDADGDGFNDGEEINRGSDPADPYSFPGTIPPKVYEDAEDGSITGWNVYDNDPLGAQINNIFEAERQSRVIQLTGSGHSNGYSLKNEDLSNWKNSNQFIIEWSQKFSEFFSVYVKMETTAGSRSLTYKPVDYNNLGNGKYVYHGLGTGARDGQWHAFERDLQADLEEAQPGVAILEINGFFIRGSGYVDDIILKSD